MIMPTPALVTPGGIISNIKEMLLVSVSEHIIRHCKNPVLVVKK